MEFNLCSMMRGDWFWWFLMVVIIDWCDCIERLGLWCMTMMVIVMAMSCGHTMMVSCTCMASWHWFWLNDTLRWSSCLRPALIFMYVSLCTGLGEEHDSDKHVPACCTNICLQPFIYFIFGGAPPPLTGNTPSESQIYPGDSIWGPDISE